MMQQEEWMNLQEFRPLADAGVPWSEIARLAGCDPRTAKKYLSGPPRLPCYRSRPAPGRVIDPFIGTIDAWLRASKGALCATTIYERLAAEPYRFGGSYQRVKQYVRARRPEICAELGIPDRSAQMHRRFEVAPGAQAQVDWGDEGVLADGTHVCELPHGALLLARPLLPLHDGHRPRHLLTPATRRPSRTSAACRRRSSTTAPRRWSRSTSAAASR